MRLALKKLMNTLKEEGYIIKKLDQYLLSLDAKDEERRWDINSPSSAGACPRAIVYSRLGYERDYCAIDAKTRRVFDNGTHTHIRLQEYLINCGLLAMDEVPVFDDYYQIQGHTDGLVNISKTELGILEIKTINTDNFKKLIDAKEEHKDQAQVYMYCLENRRKFIRGICSTEEELDKYLDSPEYREFILAHYTHLVDGSKYSAEEKKLHRLQLHQKADRILWRAIRPINKIIFLYEDKNTQDLKEFCVKWDDDRVADLLDKFQYINTHVANKTIPPRPEGSSKMGSCRWCNFKGTCWIV